MDRFYGLLRIEWSLFDSNRSSGSRDIVKFLIGRRAKSSAIFMHKKWYACACVFYVYFGKKHVRLWNHISATTQRMKMILAPKWPEKSGDFCWSYTKDFHVQEKKSRSYLYVTWESMSLLWKGYCEVKYGVSCSRLGWAGCSRRGVVEAERSWNM